MNDIYNDEDVAPNALRGGALMKFNKGVYTDAAGNAIAAGTRMLVVQTDKGVERWENGKASVIWRDENGRLPDPEQLNDEIPIWEHGLDGKPRPPWAYIFCVYLLDTDSGKKWSYVHGTTGAKIAYDELRGAIQNKKLLCGVDVLPVVELRAGTTWKSKTFGSVPRADFHPVQWLSRGNDGAWVPAPDPLRQLSSGGAAPPKQIAPPAAPQAPKQLPPRQETVPDWSRTRTTNNSLTTTIRRSEVLSCSTRTAAK
jgi:hypothetical protein